MIATFVSYEPAGSYEAKVALNESWDVNYGQGGVQNGNNITFNVPVDHAKVSFRYDSVSHVLTILAGHGHDNNVEWDGLRHDSRDLLYRTPGGAVPAGRARSRTSTSPARIASAPPATRPPRSGTRSRTAF